MKAVVYQGPEIVVIEETERPALQTDEVLVKVEAVGICGSELEGYLGHSSVRSAPLIMGHEFCGIIAEVSPGAEEIKVGERVVVNPLIHCGYCDRCEQGKPNICRNRKIIGINRPGAFAEYVAVPKKSIYAVPAEAEPALLSLAEPLAVCIHAVKLGFQPFGDLIIFGAGPIGILTLQVALNMGAKKVLVVDRQEQRLAFAEKLGAHTATPERLGEQFDQLFSNQGVDVIMDCVGVEQTREQAIRMINPGGQVIMVGLGHDVSRLTMNHLVRQEVVVIGSYTYSPSDFKQAIELLIKGKIQRKEWTKIVRLMEAPECFKELIEGRAAVSKIILKP